MLPPMEHVVLAPAGRFFLPATASLDSCYFPPKFAVFVGEGGIDLAALQQ